MKTLNINTDKCICGSGRLIQDCCLFERKNTIPKPPVTYFSNKGCYANSLQDCSKKISQEHYISESVLLEITSHPYIQIAGFPWLKNGEYKNIPTSALTAGVLCDRHNPALSGLDDIAQKFFAFLIGEKIDNNLLLINGFEVERWMLKSLCGIAASGSLNRKEKSIGNWIPPKEWLNILFGNGKLSDGDGLYFATGKFSATPKQIKIYIGLNQETKEINQLLLIFSGAVFIFSMAGQPQLPFEKVHYRPQAFKIIDKNLEREVFLGWPDGKMIVLKIT